MATIDDSAPVCYLCLDGEADESGEQLRRDCACRGTDAGFVHALLDMQQTKVSRLTECMNSLIRGEIVPVVIKPTRMSLELISNLSLYRSFEGSIHKTHKGIGGSSSGEAVCTRIHVRKVEACAKEGSRGYC